MSDDRELEQALAAVGVALSPPGGGGAAAGNSAAPAVPSWPVRADSEALTDYDNQLIFELVSNLRKPEEVLTKYGLTKEQLVQKQRNPDWAKRFREISLAWNSDTNLQERVRAKAGYLLEDSLVKIAAIVAGNHTAAMKLQAVDRLMQISRVTAAPKEGEQPGGGTRIIIKIGDDKQVVVGTETQDGQRTAVAVSAAHAARDA